MTAPAPWRNRITGSGEEAPDQLLANPSNWRVHPAAQRNALRGSLETVGWVAQVMVNQRTGHVVDGHARVEEAISRGVPSVPVLYVDLSPDEEALVLATLDPIGAMADRDDEKLRSLLAEIAVDDAGLAALLGDLAGGDPKPGLTDPDDVPEPPAEPYVKPGELYQLGDHRLLCGDATRPADVARLMDGARADCVFTDPPYGVDIASRTGTRGVANSTARAKGARGIENDALGLPEMTAFLRLAFGAMLSSCAPGAAWYVCAPHNAIGLAFSLTLSEINVWRHTLVWVKDRLVMGRADYHYRHEPIYYGWAPGAAHHAVADRTQDTVWEFPRPSASPEHPTMKPVALVERAVHNSTSSQELVLDPFAGSGTTIIAAERLGRSCYAMEIDPKYVQVAIARWQAFTGRTAERLDG